MRQLVGFMYDQLFKDAQMAVTLTRQELPNLLYLLERMGVETGISLPGVARASGLVAEALGATLPSRARSAWAAEEGRDSPGA